MPGANGESTNDVVLLLAATTVALLLMTLPTLYEVPGVGSVKSFVVLRRIVTNFEFHSVIGMVIELDVELKVPKLGSDKAVTVTEVIVELAVEQGVVKTAL